MFSRRKRREAADASNASDKKALVDTQEDPFRSRKTQSSSYALSSQPHVVPPSPLPSQEKRQHEAKSTSRPVSKSSSTGLLTPLKNKLLGRRGKSLSQIQRDFAADPARKITVDDPPNRHVQPSRPKRMEKDEATATYANVKSAADRPGTPPPDIERRRRKHAAGSKGESRREQESSYLSTPPPSLPSTKSSGSDSASSLVLAKQSSPVKKSSRVPSAPPRTLSLLHSQPPPVTHRSPDRSGIPLLRFDAAGLPQTCQAGLDALSQIDGPICVVVVIGGDRRAARQVCRYLDPGFRMSRDDIDLSQTEKKDADDSGARDDGWNDGVRITQILEQEEMIGAGTHSKPALVVLETPALGAAANGDAGGEEDEYGNYSASPREMNLLLVSLLIASSVLCVHQGEQMDSVALNTFAAFADLPRCIDPSTRVEVLRACVPHIGWIVVGAASNADMAKDPEMAARLMLLGNEETDDEGDDKEMTTSMAVRSVLTKLFPQQLLFGLPSVNRDTPPSSAYPTNVDDMLAAQSLPPSGARSVLQPSRKHLSSLITHFSKHTTTLPKLSYAASTDLIPLPFSSGAHLNNHILRVTAALAQPNPVMLSPLLSQSSEVEWRSLTKWAEREYVDRMTAVAIPDMPLDWASLRKRHAECVSRAMSGVRDRVGNGGLNMQGKLWKKREESFQKIVGAMDERAKVEPVDSCLSAFVVQNYETAIARSKSVLLKGIEDTRDLMAQGQFTDLPRFDAHMKRLLTQFQTTLCSPSLLSPRTLAHLFEHFHTQHTQLRSQLIRQLQGAVQHVMEQQLRSQTIAMERERREQRERVMHATEVLRQVQEQVGEVRVRAVAEEARLRAEEREARMRLETALAGPSASPWSRPGVNLNSTWAAQTLPSSSAPSGPASRHRRSRSKPPSSSSSPAHVSTPAATGGPEPKASSKRPQRRPLTSAKSEADLQVHGIYRTPSDPYHHPAYNNSPHYPYPTHPPIHSPYHYPQNFAHHLSSSSLNQFHQPYSFLHHPPPPQEYYAQVYPQPPYGSPYTAPRKAHVSGHRARSKSMAGTLNGRVS
ncbi:hypothetical protein DFS34DRAFT_240718 [Phlyctochytrium arcticum]|nr:hypothetical protein DFS34DRAFT_240718 [Phlyctochytrium arcticum]